MLTQTARRSWAHPDSRRVCTRSELVAAGTSQHRIRAQLAAHRWQLIGRAIVLHNGEVTRLERWQVARLNCGPQAVLAAFTAAEQYGLRGWQRETVHILGPAGSRYPSNAGIPIRLHRTGRRHPPARTRTQPLPAALVLAASTFDSARPACGILAAAVQQRLASAEVLSAELAHTPRARHRAAMIAAVADIAGGCEALSEIDFHRLCCEPGCRRHNVRPSGSTGPAGGAISMPPGVAGTGGWWSSRSTVRFICPPTNG